MQLLHQPQTIPLWLDSETRSLVEDIIDTLDEYRADILAVILYGSIARHEERPLDDPDTSDVDLLVLLDSDDWHLPLYQSENLSHTLGLAYTRHLDTPREVQVQFSSRSMQEWDPTFIANVAHDGILIFARGPLPAVLTAPTLI